MTNMDAPDRFAGMTVSIVSSLVYWHQKSNVLISMSANYSGFAELCDSGLEHSKKCPRARKLN